MRCAIWRSGQADRSGGTVRRRSRSPTCLARGARGRAAGRCRPAARRWPRRSCCRGTVSSRLVRRLPSSGLVDLPVAPVTSAGDGRRDHEQPCGVEAKFFTTSRVTPAFERGRRGHGGVVETDFDRGGRQLGGAPRVVQPEPTAETDPPPSGGGGPMMRTDPPALRTAAPSSVGAGRRPRATRAGARRRASATRVVRRCTVGCLAHFIWTDGSG